MRIACLFTLLLTACTTAPPAAQRTQDTNQLAISHGWSFNALAGTPFTLASAAPRLTAPIPILHVYIEGDGLAWTSGRAKSSDPTPITPVALEMALTDTAPAIYLARPCQYLSQAPTCRDNKWWTSHRFAPEVIAATNSALDTLKQKYQVQQFVLIGYSGGGAVAALVAAQRQDVSGLITVAGNLDTAFWTKHHKLTPLNGSLNPADAAQKLASTPQTHFVGAKDKIVPPIVARSYAAHFPRNAQPNIAVIDGYDHRCCWAQNWPSLLTQIKQ